MSRKRAIFLSVFICAILFVNLCIISSQNTSKKEVLHYDPMEKIPLLLSGCFRGIAVDFLWARAIARHEEKKYYELLTINNLIAKLQPNFPAVWIFQAWNMAYNVAHEWDSPHNKWKWIYNGLNYAKKGTEKNPDCGDLFFELGYMYQHLFSPHPFKFADFYRTQLKMMNNEDNYEESLFWMRKALLHSPKIMNPMAIERMIGHVLLKASECAEREGNLDKAMKYTEEAIHEWQTYREKHPDDMKIMVDNTLKILTERKENLQSLLNTWEIKF